MHHGGIGTTAEALRHSKAHLVVPFLGHQLDHAARLERFGVARSIKPSQYCAKRTAKELDILLKGPYRQRAQTYGNQFSGEDGAGAAAAYIIKLLALFSCAASPFVKGKLLLPNNP